MNITKKLARKIIFPTLMAAGGDKLIRLAGGSSCVNMMYHGVVASDSTYFSPRHITSEQFDRQLKYLKRNFDVISISDAFNHVQNGIPFKRKTVTVSFDDGFQNNLTTALPLLEKHQIPTTFYVSSICAEEMSTRWLWSEVVAALKYFRPTETIQLGEHPFINYVDTNHAITFTSFLKTVPFELRDQYINELIQKFDLESRIREIPEEVWQLLNKSELVELSNSSLVEIGSHGHLHYNLGDIEIEKASDELVKSKRILEETIGKSVATIAYPDGSYSEAVKDLAQGAGYTGQLAVNYKTANDSSDVRIMNRHGISSTTTYESTMLFLNKAFISKGIKL